MNPCTSMSAALTARPIFPLTPTTYLADSDGFDARTLRELHGIVTANKELIERSWNEHFA